jgi:hypothetical protein
VRPEPNSLKRRALPALVRALTVALLFAAVWVSGAALVFGQPAGQPAPAPSGSAPPTASAPPAGSAPPAAPPGPATPPDPTGGPGGPGGPQPPLPPLPPTEAELARGLVIDKVTITGNARLPLEDIEALLRNTRVGQVFSPEALAQDVKEMWRSLYFDDIKVELTKTDAGAAIRVIVSERPSIKTIEFEGNSAVDADDLIEALSVEVKIGSDSEPTPRSAAACRSSATSTPRRASSSPRSSTPSSSRRTTGRPQVQDPPSTSRSPSAASRSSATTTSPTTSCAS